MEVASNIIPYVSPEEFEEMQAQIEEELRKHREEHHVLGRKYEFSGKYDYPDSWKKFRDML